MLKCWKENGQPGFLDSVKNTRHEAKQTLLQAKMRKSYTTKNTEESSYGRKNTIQGGKTEIYPENEGDMPRGVKANKRKTYFQKIIDQSAPVMKILASFYKTILQSQGLGSLEKWTHTHTHTHTHTQIGLCQRDPGAN